MTQFVKYTHVERLGTTETHGIMEGKCWVFPKLDGTNASLWLCKDGTLQAGSRNRHLKLDDDNAGFYEAMVQNNAVNSFLQSNPTMRLFGEWLVPHSLRTYNPNAWRQFYVFDVYDGDRVLSYDEYQPLLEEHGVEYVPPIFMVERPTEERLFNALEQNNFLIKDGEGSGEGVVIKNYEFTNRFGRLAYAKIVTAEFKAKHTKAMGVRQIKEKSQIEDAIAAEYVTKSLVDKAYAKIENECGGFGSKDIPRLLHTVYYDVVREEIWNIVRKHKNPILNFGALQRAVFGHTKIYKPELFGVRTIQETEEKPDMGE